jgi:hypothetical protein
MTRQTLAVGLTLILMPMISTPVRADIYRWKDAGGVIHFSNEPPPPGAAVLETIEEAPYDAEADRRRIEEERRLNLERRSLELEERKAGLASREREAQMRLDEAERRLNEAQQLQQRSQESSQDDDCDEDYYLRFGRCGHPAHGYRYYPARPGSPNLYRGYYRDNNNLYYKEPRRPGHPPGHPPPGRRDVKPPFKANGLRAADPAKKQSEKAGEFPPKGMLAPQIPASK